MPILRVVGLAGWNKKQAVNIIDAIGFLLGILAVAWVTLVVCLVIVASIGDFIVGSKP